MSRRITLGLLCLTPFLGIDTSRADPSHALAMHGIPDVPAGTPLPYANSKAPKGGSITYGEIGQFDTLNLFTVRGRAPRGMSNLVFESLMTRSYDEPFSVYGLLAESIETDKSRSWVAFCLEPEARFSSGDRVTVDDVVFSMETLRSHGRPNFRSYYKQIATVERPAPGCVRFVFEKPDRELPLLLGLMPILSQSDWTGKDFTETTLDAPVGSGPYRVSKIDAGSSLKLARRSDYWGADKPIKQGLHNANEVAILYFGDENARWEAFTSGLIDFRQESNPSRWAEEYTFPAVQSGDVLKGEIVHHRATGMFGFVFNTRRPIFADRRVREALTLAFDFEWTNATFNRDAYRRITSYYGNSPLGFEGPAKGRERALLTPFEDSLPAGTLDQGYSSPSSAPDGQNRVNLRRAKRLLREAGWRVEEGQLVDAGGNQFSFEILVSSRADEKIATIYAQMLKRLGINASPRLVGSAEYQERLTGYSYDMIMRRWWLSLSPGAEQRFYFGSEGVSREGTRNYMGADHPAIDAMVDAILAAETPEDHRAAVRALDRVLVAGRYVIPLWFEPADRVAWRRPLAKPDRDPLYGYRPEVWWVEPQDE